MVTVLAAWACLTLDSWANEPKHYVFFGADRERIAEKSFVETKSIVGAQLKYRWRELEPSRNKYDFSSIRHDLAALKKHRKRLFVQLQDISFMKARQVVPEYLTSEPEFHGGVEAGYSYPAAGTAAFSTWVPRRWDPAVRARLKLLLQALGAAFDGKIEGINFAETAIDTPAPDKPWQGWSPKAYYESIRDLMHSARRAFMQSKVLFYANFMPSDPAIKGDGHAYLKGIYQLADDLGVGVGGPDLLPKRWPQQHTSLPLIAARGRHTVAGMAVQDGNLADRDEATGKKVTAAELAAYARERLRLDYVFWGTEEPYWTSEVLPYLRSLPPRPHPRS